MLLLDPGSLQDSLLNLILNAGHAMAGPGRIVISAEAAGQWLQLTVADSGPGFSPEALDRATEPFFTTRPGRGTGMGLSMAYDNTKLSGGTMRLENGPSGGARVRLSLPLRRVEPQMVLLADDDATIRAAVRDMLRSLGHAVIEAESLAEARAMTDLPGLTLILSDVQLGDGRGQALAGAGLPMVLMTALPPGAAERADAPGPVLTKPFDLAALAAAVAQASHG